MFSKEIFAGRLAQLRKEQKVTAQAVAEAIGVTRPAITRFEHGLDFPRVTTLVALADYFDVSADYLLGRSDNPARRWEPHEREEQSG